MSQFITLMAWRLQLLPPNPCRTTKDTETDVNNLYHTDTSIDCLTTEEALMLDVVGDEFVFTLGLRNLPTRTNFLLDDAA
jgi:hypothetical protein